MGLNFAGNTWGTNYISFNLLRSVSVRHPHVLDRLIQEYASDLERLCTEGVWNTARTKRVWAVHIGAKGDLLAQTKLASFIRDYSRMPKQGSSRTACPGICFLCHAGKEQPGEIPDSFPYGDFNGDALWKTTMHASPAWVSSPSILRGVPLVPGCEAAFFAIDLWHCWHYGAAKVFVANVLVLLESKKLAPGNSVDARLAWLSAAYRAFHRSQRLSSPPLELNKDSLGYPAVHASPCGRWPKGSSSTDLMYWLEAFFHTHVAGKVADPLLLLLASWPESQVCLCVVTAGVLL